MTSFDFLCLYTARIHTKKDMGMVYASPVHDLTMHHVQNDKPEPAPLVLNFTLFAYFGKNNLFNHQNPSNTGTASRRPFGGRGRLTGPGERIGGGAPGGIASPPGSPRPQKSLGERPSAIDAIILRGDVK